MAPPHPTSTSKSKKKVKMDDSDDEDDKPIIKSNSSKKRKSIAVESSEESEDGGKPKSKAKPSVGGSASKKKSTRTADDDFIVPDDEDDDATVKVKGKGKTAPPAKKAKQEGENSKGGAEKPKWVFKQRAGPSNPGTISPSRVQVSKDIPAGEENCLGGLTFVFTGELDSLSREAGQELVKRYGGRVTSAPSSKTSYVVLGNDAGPKKLEMIKKHKIKTLTEDDFLALIGNRPSGADDPAYLEQKKKEEEKVKEQAKSLGPKKDDSNTKNSLWTVKYAPQKLADICGNKGNVEKLSRWLEAWPKSLKSDFKKPGPDAMGGFRCVLISGPPGIGKTTAAHLVSKLLDYNILELNASDVRSKKLLESAFKSTIENTTLKGFVKTADSGDTANPGVNDRSVIIMDEVDGMSAGDRGGVGALNMLIKKTKVPIIAICNDKSTPKMKPLIHTCFQMTFRRPTVAEIRSRMMESMKIEGKVMDQLVEGSHSDIRQVVNMLSAWRLSARTMDFDEGRKVAKMNEKNTIQTPWTLYNQLFGPQSFSAVSSMTLDDKINLYYQDFSMMPLFVQDNYLHNRFSRASNLQGKDKELKNLELISKAAEAISDGDLVDAMIHGTQSQWSLMPVHGMFSCVRPAFYCYGAGGHQPTFPTWFGKNSTQTKLQRMLGEIQIRMRLRVSGDRREIRQSYIPTLFPKIVAPLQERGADGIDEVIQLLDDYYLTKEDWDAIIELGVGDGFGQEEVLKKIPSSVKSAFTRNYNKTDHPVPFHRGEGGPKISKKLAKSGTPDVEDVQLEDADSEEEVLSDEDGEGDVSKDSLIKAVKPKGGKKETTSAPAGKKKK
ncbi:DNA replication factor C, large subunit [Meredithblackwellia eburnea MCA 4105]